MAVNKNPFQVLLEQLPAPLRNKYFVALAIFFAMLIFFSKADPITQYRLESTKKQLEEDKEYYSKKIKGAEQERLDLEFNKEKTAREKYYMKKNDEDVFIIVDESKVKKD